MNTTIRVVCLNHNKNVELKIKQQEGGKHRTYPNMNK